MVKINIAYPHMSRQKTIEIDDEHKMHPFYEKRMGAEVAGDTLGDEWKGYLMKVSGGNDKQGFPMKQGVLTNGRKQLLFKKGMSCYRERRGGMRKRKTVRGCIVSHDLSILNLVVVKKGDAEVEGLTTEPKSRRLGPKRASKIRKLFGLEKADDVKKYVVRRSVKGEESKKTKAPKIQRLVTNARIQRKRRVKTALVKKVIANREEKTAYVQKMHDYRIRMKERRAAEMAKKKKGKAKKSE